MTATSQALNRLIAAALACNLTRVYTHVWSGPQDNNSYPSINVNSAHHELTHAGKDFRIVLMGHAGGKLPGNRYLRLEQQVMGLQVTEYGSWDKTTRTMPEILV
jgi:hypothetical protein